jgi:hypothetical protein
MKKALDAYKMLIWTMEVKKRNFQKYIYEDHIKIKCGPA